MAISSLGGSAILVEAAVNDVFVDGVSVVNNKVAQINLTGKQNKLTAGSNITISDNTISATDTIYDDTALAGRVTTIEGKEAGWDAKQSAITDIAEIRSGAQAGATAVQPAGLSGYATQAWVNSEGFLKEHQSLAAYRTAVQQDAIHDATKQDVISDLSTIRSGAALGATAAQQSDLLSYRTSAAQDVIDAGKQKKLTAGTNITINSEGVISAAGKEYSSGNGISIEDDVIKANIGQGLKFDSEGKITFDTTEIIGGRGIQFHNNTIEVNAGQGLTFDSEGKLTTTSSGGGEVHLLFQPDESSEGAWIAFDLDKMVIGEEVTYTPRQVFDMITVQNKRAIISTLGLLQGELYATNLPDAGLQGLFSSVIGIAMRLGCLYCEDVDSQDWVVSYV